MDYTMLQHICCQGRLEAQLHDAQANSLSPLSELANVLLSSKPNTATTTVTPMQQASLLANGRKLPDMHYQRLLEHLQSTGRPLEVLH